MSPTLNIISETKRVVRPLLENLKTSISPDMLDAGMGMKKKKEKKEKKSKDIDKNAPKKVNPWIAHLQEFRKNHPEMSYKECMKAAKPSWEEKRNSQLMSGEPKKIEEKKPKKKASASESPEKTEAGDSENEKNDEDKSDDNDE